MIKSEDLPAFPRPGYFVVNTDHCGNEGQHWTVFYFPKEGGPCEFFDSMAKAPGYYHSRFEQVLIANGPLYKYIGNRLQALESDVCGQYCIYYVVQRHLNRSMEGICDKNDKLVSRFVKTLLMMYSMYSHYTRTYNVDYK